MRILIQLYLILLLVSLAAARNVEARRTEIKNVNIVPSGENLKVEVTLTGSVNPSVVIATNPDRLVLELPNTVTQAKQQHIAVNCDGVKDVRIGLKSAAPLLTRLVVDLDNARPYGLAVTGKTIALTILPEGATANNAEPNRPLIASSGIQGGADAIVVATPSPASTIKEVSPLRFRVKYVVEGMVYLAGGRKAGLEEGMALVVREGARNADQPGASAVAELRIISVAQTSAVAEVHAAKRVLRRGDWAYLSQEQTESLLANRNLPAASRHLAVVPFSASRPQNNVVREDGSTRAPSETNRIRGRIGFDYSGFSSRGSIVGTSNTIGLVARTDITGIGGTHWNLNGYWRGRITNKSRTEEETLQNVLNKTYTMQLTYDNPESKWVAGFGRLYLPWANSLDTIDGGYIGRRVADGVTTGVFLGSTPDPTSWHYNPNQQFGGSFVNFEGGSYDDLHYTSTAGVALSMLKWKLDRPFLFLENGLSYKRTVSVYHSFIVDAPQGVSTNGITPGAGVSRSYLTVHYQPHERIAFDFYHNYFRDVPTAATQLVGTGLVDKLLYQGISAGVRIEPVRHFFLYTTLGRSDKTGDARQTLNQLYGFSWDEIRHTGIRADFHYSKFDSSFGRGDYKVLTLSRHLGDQMMWDTQIGFQNLTSPFTVNTGSSHFFDTSMDVNLFRKSFLQSGYTVVRGSQMNYNQWYLSLGYRFDVKPEQKFLQHSNAPGAGATSAGTKISPPAN